MSDDEWVGVVQFPLAANASPVAVRVRIHFCLMAGPCNTQEHPSLSDISRRRWLYEGGDWQTNKTNPSLPLLMPAPTGRPGESLTRGRNAAVAAR